MKNFCAETSGKSGDRVIARDRVIGETSSLAFTAPRRLCGDVFVQITGSPDHRITRFSSALRRAGWIIRATIFEIFDESAYERFLSRKQTIRSVASYREFLREREEMVVRKPRCC